MEICTMYVETRNSVLIDSSFRTDHGMATKKALINSGATDNFIDQNTAERLKIEPRRLQQPQVLHNIDGTTNRDGKVLRLRHLCLHLFFFPLSLDTYHGLAVVTQSPLLYDSTELSRMTDAD